MKKRICFVDYDMSVRGGVEQVTASLANALADTYEVHIISLCMTGTLNYALDERVNFIALLDSEDRLRTMHKAIKPLLHRYFKDHHIDVAMLQGNYAGLLAADSRFGTKTKLVFCDHGALMNQWDRKDIVFIRWLSSRLCHKTVTLTEQSRNDYRKRFLLGADRVLCIYNWIDLDIDRSSCYNTQSKRLLSAGRFGKEKGFDLLIRAFAPVAAAHPDWHLDLFGDGEMRPVVESLIAEYGLQDHVTLPGMCHDLAQRYREYAMYVLPSYREGLPLVLLEAKANRLPIVSFDVVTGPREIVRDGIDGVLVPPLDVETLSAAICRLIENEEERCRMAHASQENLEKFSKPAILEQWQTLIESL